jgi:hypothetical protein
VQLVYVTDTARIKSRRLKIPQPVSGFDMALMRHRGRIISPRSLTRMQKTFVRTVCIVNFFLRVAFFTAFQGQQTGGSLQDHGATQKENDPAQFPVVPRRCTAVREKFHGARQWPLSHQRSWG